MAFIQCDFHSETLGLACSMNVILPQRTSSQIGLAGKAGDGRFPTLFLLHGMSDDHSIWMRRTSIERYVAPLGLAVVMPAVHRSYYSNMVHGGRYWDFVSEELPALARSFFPLSDRREDNFVAGLSMGGYGAFKLAFACPEKFAAAASLSGALDVGGHFNALGEERSAEFQRIFGPVESIPSTDNDLFHLAKQLKASGKPIPSLFQCCGTDDFLYKTNLKFHNFLKGQDFDLTYLEAPGTHEWGFWDKHIQDVLNWLPLRREA